ncbi:MAG: crotonase/enoyl-CoA hydratase family protein [Nitriliruptorales bacterium]
MGIRTERDGPVLVVAIDRPEVRNAVDRPTADALEAAFRDFDADGDLSVAVLTGAGGAFCSGADLGAVSSGDERANRVEAGEHAPMGPTRLLLDKPVVAAVEGHAVAGGLELALWCDLRVVAEDAVLGVFCRRWGVPLMDGGTVRLPRLIGLSAALDLILTGRPVDGREAAALGLANRLVPPGEALAEAVALAHDIAAFPQRCLRNDRRSAHESFGLGLAEALMNEHAIGVTTIASGETVEGARRFAAGAGRHGSFDPAAPD